MQTIKIIKFDVHKEDYRPADKKERHRVGKILCKQIIDVANRFDGTVSFEIKIHAKGNA